MALPSDTASLDATAQAELVRSGQASPLELVDAAIARVERLNGTLNAVVTPLFERAREAAAGDLPDGPLRGVPFLLKDLAALSAGEPYHAGLKAARQAGWVADHDAELTRRYRAAGLVWLGKTNTSELGLLPATESEAYGPCRNPWDTGRSAGGSSGGSGAAVAAGMVPLAGASDGGGSIRIPASECGLVGLKPSRGRVPLWPDVAEAWGGLVASLAVSRSVRDTAAVLDAVAGPCPGDLHTPPAPARPYVREVGAAPGRLRASAMVAFTIPFNITGQPAISLPLGWTATGLPLGVQLVAAYGREDLLLRVAAQLEEVAPWADRRPAVHA